MTLRIGTTKGSIWQRIKAHYIVAIFGLAIAASALFAIATSHRLATPTPGVGSSSPAAAQAVQAPSFVYYLAASQQQAALFDAVLSSERSTLASANEQTITLVVDTPEAESLIAEATRELMQSGVDFRVVDLRTPSPVKTALNSDERSVSQPSSQLDADIMASVISTEQATWAPGGAD